MIIAWYRGGIWIGTGSMALTSVLLELRSFLPGERVATCVAMASGNKLAMAIVQIHLEAVAN